MDLDYDAFVERKSHLKGMEGFAPHWMPDFLFPFQEFLLDWSIRKGKAAKMTDCGTGKTPMELVWAQNCVMETNKPTLILTPLAVTAQFEREGEKFGIECKRSKDGRVKGENTVTNYEQLHKFDWKDFGAVVCDESSILKSFDGALKNEITEFMKKVPYRLLATATAAPNDYIELGTSSEALGYLGFVDMLNMFFKNDLNNSATRRMYGEAPKWRFKGHAEDKFWRWVTSWARAARSPRDLGFDDERFNLPELSVDRHMVSVDTVPEGKLFTVPATNLFDQRKERKRTLNERCEKASEIVNAESGASIMWCHGNAEGDLLEKMIDGAVQVSGRDSDDKKEEKFLAFISGEAKKLVTKPIIGAWGLNFQHCAHVAYFPSHSYEQYYQAIRRCWRFGQTKPVKVDIVLTEGELAVMANLERKTLAADEMFSRLVSHMNDALTIGPRADFTTELQLPKWLNN